VTDRIPFADLDYEDQDAIRAWLRDHRVNPDRVPIYAQFEYDPATGEWRIPVYWHDTDGRMARKPDGETVRTLEQIARAAVPKRQLKGCPSEAAYRRHLKAREKCHPCRDFMHRIEQERRARHPEWWVHGAGVPVRATTAWPDLSNGGAR
jgi:hypothetical protein